MRRGEPVRAGPEVCSDLRYPTSVDSEHLPSERLAQELLRHVPDEPGWIDARGILLEGPTVFGSAAGYVAVRTGGMLLAAIGRPERSAIQAARRIVTHGAELVCPDSSAAHLQDTLGTKGRRAFMHTVGPAGFPRARARPTTTLVDDLRHLPDDLEREVRAYPSAVPVAAGLVDGVPVSFCFPTVVTERYWDVTIETCESYRRRGLAVAAFLRAVDEMRKSGREPVWGAEEDNVASLRLAEKLGFVHAATIWVFEVTARP